MTGRFRLVTFAAIAAVAGSLAAGCSKEQSTSEQSTTEQSTAKATTAACDRDCLKGMVDTYLAALVAHDPSQAPMATDAKFVENVMPTAVGEGLWKTASAVPTTFAIYVPDPVSEQVGFLGMMQENDKPIELALRLKVVDGKITEAEHLIARDLSEANLANLQNRGRSSWPTFLRISAIRVTTCSRSAPSTMTPWSRTKARPHPSTMPTASATRTA